LEYSKKLQNPITTKMPSNNNKKTSLGLLSCAEIAPCTPQNLQLIEILWSFFFGEAGI
jgi:hypothetical protein